MIAFVFPGQGAQVVGMGRALADAFPEAREVFDEANDALGEPLSRLIFDGPAGDLMLTENTQPAILTMSVAAARVLGSHRLHPQLVAGHSLGEYSAHVVAGTFSFADAVRTVRARGRFMQEAVPFGDGAMAAILGLPDDQVTAACDAAMVGAAVGEVVSPANLNAPGQVVIAGTVAAVERAISEAKGRGARRAIPLPVSAPFHCALMQPAEVRLAPLLRTLTTSDPQVPVVANVDAAPKTTGGDAIEALVQQVSAPVRWQQVMQQLSALGAHTFVEVGPGAVLSGLGKKVLAKARFARFESPEQLAEVQAVFQ